MIFCILLHIFFHIPRMFLTTTGGPPPPPPPPPRTRAQETDQTAGPSEAAAAGHNPTQQAGERSLPPSPPPPSPPPLTPVPEADPAAAGSTAVGRGSRARGEGCRTCGRVLGANRIISAYPSSLRERRRVQAEEEEGAMPSLPPSSEHWEALAVLDLSMQEWATGCTLALARASACILATELLRPLCISTRARTCF